VPPVPSGFCPLTVHAGLPPPKIKVLGSTSLAATFCASDGPSLVTSISYRP